MYIATADLLVAVTVVLCKHWHYKRTVDRLGTVSARVLRLTACSAFISEIHKHLQHVHMHMEQRYSLSAKGGGAIPVQEHASGPEVVTCTTCSKKAWPAVSRYPQS